MLHFLRHIKPTAKAQKLLHLSNTDYEYVEDCLQCLRNIWVKVLAINLARGAKCARTATVQYCVLEIVSTQTLREWWHGLTLPDPSHWLWSSSPLGSLQMGDVHTWWPQTCSVPRSPRRRSEGGCLGPPLELSPQWWCGPTAHCLVPTPRPLFTRDISDRHTHTNSYNW